ncbi:MAG: hypothetical protein HWN67_15790 [Candidatus Helarchaeota archaeon]|nr:hypothetical protein [Candidatus Helarchaeota archaeon]
MKNEIKIIIFAAIIITCIIFIIIGIFTVVNAFRGRMQLMNLPFYIIFFTDPFDSSFDSTFDSMFFIMMYLMFGEGPYYLNFVSGVVMIIISLIVLIVSLIIFNKTRESKPIFSSYQPSKPRRIYRVKKRKKYKTNYCPACKAPLKKSPPCECEYCGRIVG